MSQTSPTQREYGRAIKAIAQSRREVERLLADVSWDQEYTLGQLARILSDLKDAQATLEHLQNHA